ncbi:hypothetical protein UA70_15235 [Raoultella planticola]|nr:hypothetical protein UA70_15235 [Raoultella planticola]
MHLLEGRRRQHFAVTIMALLADNTLRFHLFDNTCRTVISDAELTLTPEIEALRFSVTKFTA